MHLYTVPVQYKAIKPYMPVGRRDRLQSGWTSVMYEIFHALVPTCALTFTNNYLSTDGVWRGDARCKTREDCVKVRFKMTVQDVTTDEDNVDVTVEVAGSCTHQHGEGVIASSNTRNMSGSERRNLVMHLQTTGIPPTEWVYSKLGEMGVQECQAGNLTKARSARVIQKALSEAAKKAQFHAGNVTNCI